MNISPLGGRSDGTGHTIETSEEHPLQPPKSGWLEVAHGSNVVTEKPTGR